MKVMIDTNIFISAALFPNGKASAALEKALAPPYQPHTCDYVIDELHRKFREKFPGNMAELEEPTSAASGRTAPAERCSLQRHLWPR